MTGLILAGGRGSRMGGVDKGLQTFNGMPLALHTLTRLQLGGGVGEIMINANRNLAAYESFGVPVWPDGLADYAGPLAGFLTGLERCETPTCSLFPATRPCCRWIWPVAWRWGWKVMMQISPWPPHPRKIAMASCSCAPNRCFVCCASVYWKAWCDLPRTVGENRCLDSAPQNRLGTVQRTG